MHKLKVFTFPNFTPIHTVAILSDEWCWFNTIKYFTCSKVYKSIVTEKLKKEFIILLSFSYKSNSKLLTRIVSFLKKITKPYPMFCKWINFRIFQMFCFLLPKINMMKSIIYLLPMGLDISYGFFIKNGQNVVLEFRNIFNPCSEK